MKKIVFLLLATSYWLLATPAHADFSLGVYPPILQIDATPPTSIKQNITLVNQSDSAVSLSVGFKPFTQNDNDNGEVQYTDNFFAADPSIFQKIQLLDNNSPMSVIQLAPKQQKTFTLHVGLPKNEPAGDYYFSIVFSANPSSAPTDNSGSALSGGIATNVLLSVGPKGPVNGFIEDYSAPYFVTNGPVNFSIKANNLSRQFITPHGEILIKNMFGQLIGKVDLLPVNILAGTSRFVPSSGLPNTATKAVWPEKFLLGMYKANLVFSLSPQGPIFTRSIYFFAMPWQYILGGIIAILLIGFIVYRVRERLR